MKTIELTDTEWNELLNAWREENDNGNGDAFNFGTDDDGRAIEGTVADAMDRPDVEMIAMRGNQAVFMLVEAFDPHKVLMVCDANGPWVCDVNSTFRLIEARRNYASGIYV